MDLLLLTAFFLGAPLLTQITVFELLTQFLLPFNVTCCICFRCLYGGSNSSEAFSILLCNVLCPVIDDRVLPVRFGSGKKPVLEISLYAIFAAMAAATVVLSAVFRG